MKLKSLFILLAFFITAGAQAQLTVDIFINGIKSGQYIVKDEATTGGITYKKSVYKNMDRLSILVKGKNIEGPFIRTVEVMADGEKPIFTAEETAGINGQFLLTDKAILKRLAKGKAINLYLIRAPANTKMMQPTRKFYIGSLSTGK